MAELIRLMYNYLPYMKNTKAHRGHPPRTDVWVFGMVDVSHSPALGFMQVVPRRDAATLLPIIQQHLHPGTEVHSDEWAAYRQVQQLPPVTQHLTVNHSLTTLQVHTHRT